MIWPFQTRKANGAYVFASKVAVVAVEKQYGELKEKVRKNERLAAGISSLRNTNGLVSGYALGLASVELAKSNQMKSSLEKSLADAIQSEFENYDKNIHIYKHYEANSYAFQLGVAAGGQEATNKYYNHYYWNKNADKYCFLSNFLTALTSLPWFEEMYAVSVWKTLDEDYGMHVELELISSALKEMLPSN